MKAQQALVLVDGSNVAHSDVWRRFADDEARELGMPPYRDTPDDHHRSAGRLLDWILSWMSTRGIEVIVVFDGSGPLGAGEHDWSPGYRVIGSGADGDGDSVVEREAVALRRTRRRFQLVTDDATLAAVAGIGAEVVRRVDAFVAEITTVPEPEPGTTYGLVNITESSTSRITDDLDEDTLAKLERMRRGLDP